MPKVVNKFDLSFNQNDIADMIIEKYSKQNINIKKSDILFTGITEAVSITASGVKSEKKKTSKPKKEETPEQV